MAKQIKRVPKKQIIGIKRFIEEYINAPAYKGKNTLTHNTLRAYLKENNIKAPRRISFREITEEDIRKGRVIYVRDKKGKKIPYINPLYRGEDFLSRCLERKSKEELEAIRKRLLIEELKKRKIELQKEGYIEDEEGNLVTEEDLYYEKLEEKYKTISKSKKVVYVRKTQISYKRR